MPESVNQEQKNQILFMQLVVMFQGAAMQQMGKMMNPVTNKVERDLQQAQLSIDILGMLEEKTKGNLNDEEKRFLDHALFELRMNYMDEVNKEKQEKPSEEKEEEKEGEEKPSEEKEEKGNEGPSTEESPEESDA